MTRFAVLVAAGAALLTVGVYSRTAQSGTFDELRAVRVTDAWARDAIETISARLDAIAPAWSVVETAHARGRSIEVVLFRSGPATPGQYDGGCRALVTQALVLCDSTLLDELLRRLELNVIDDPNGPEQVPSDEARPSIPAPETRLAELRRTLALWMLGHEVGHVVKGHHTAAPPAGGEFAAVPNLTISERRELEADEFVLSLFDEPAGRDGALYGFLIEALNLEVRRSLCPGQSVRIDCPKVQRGVGIFYNEDEHLLFQPGGSHPAYVIRLLRLLYLTDQRTDMDVVGYTVRRAVNRLRAEEAAQPHGIRQRVAAWFARLRATS
jgi:hypothetical protein